jgi:hypothetical protein
MHHRYLLANSTSCNSTFLELRPLSSINWTGPSKMSIGRITTSLVSGTNETTLALLNLNVDFSLVKFEAPQEFSALGVSLSRRRKQMAEEGPVHRTARRLGALF